MPEVLVNDARLFYEAIGSGPETMVFSHSYLVDSQHFASQMQSLRNRYRCVAFDHRGHGRSEVTETGYDMENLYADAVTLIEALKCDGIVDLPWGSMGFLPFDSRSHENLDGGWTFPSDRGSFTALTRHG